MKTYISKRHISHDNQDYEVGEPLELDDKTAAPLLVVGAIVDAPVEIVPDPDNAGEEDAAAADSKPATKTSKKAK